jgi:GTP pyrophosphokinase
MNAATLSQPALHEDVPLPDWLSSCLVEYDRHPDAEEVSLICRAFNFAYDLHRGQFRKSGEPYIAHPIAVAGLLRDLGGDNAMIAAGFLHDVVEDTGVTLEEIAGRFGQEVCLLVEGVTKLSKFNFSSKAEQQAENFRRMFLAMAKDIRVIVVKLADRLHNMRTLEHLKPERQQAIALETREIFAPLANRLGIWRFKWELEDLAFKYLEPDAYRNIQNLINEKRADRENRIETIKIHICDRLAEVGVNLIEIQGRPKHLYGIHQKMERSNKDFDEIYDIAALRIIVETKEECYRALAVVHDAFIPLPGRFKDYIGLPKPNRYQSLHTAVVGTNGRPLEIQIRTLDMHHVAEYGIAAHWKYKESGGSLHAKLSTSDEKFTWLRQLLDWQKELKDEAREEVDAQEYVAGLKQNLFDDDVYVFTPKGDVIALARGATPVDFAYRIHSEVGNAMKGARINGRWSVLNAPLKNGDIVEIVTQKNGHPSLDWLNFVVTPSAKNRIRQWYKRSRREENVARGRELLERELGKSGFDALLKSNPMQVVAERCNYHCVEDLLAALGYGEITTNQVVNRLREVTVKDQQPTFIPHVSNPVPSNRPSNSPIVGVEGLVYHLAGCCHPLPGEEIIGIVSRGAKGIAIHRQNCSNIASVEGDRLIPVKWNSATDGGQVPTYPIDLNIEVIDRVGVFKDILSHLSDQNINVRNAGVKTSDGNPALIQLQIDIRDRSQLERIINQIRNMGDVINIHRSRSYA